MKNKSDSHMTRKEVFITTRQSSNSIGNKSWKYGMEVGILKKFKNQNFSEFIIKEKMEMSILGHLLCTYDVWIPQVNSRGLLNNLLVKLL